MSIGAFARATGLSPKALRLYDEMGLVRPAQVDEFNGYRWYDAEQLGPARLVARLRRIGMPLDRIRTVAALPPAAAVAELLSYWRQVEADTSSRRAVVAALADHLRSEEDDMVITDVERPAVAHRLGRGARDSQLDAVLSEARVFAVADGFGRDPDVTGRVLGHLIPLDSASGPVDVVRLLDDAVTAAAAEVSAIPVDDGGAPSGCTLTAVVLGDTQVAVAHVGDSRAHLVRDGRLTRLTRDHTEVQMLLDEGRLSDEEARSVDGPALLNRALVQGMSAMPDISLHATRPGDRIVLTTDGVHAVLQPAELAALLVGSVPPEEVVAGVEAAVLATGAPDNYAVVVIEVPRTG